MLGGGSVCVILDPGSVFFLLGPLDEFCSDWISPFFSFCRGPLSFSSFFYELRDWTS